MIHNSAAVWCSQLVFRCHFPTGNPVDVTADVAYQATDPTVVSVTFYGEKRCPWVFGRDLLSEGLLGGTEAEPVGPGDVKVWTTGGDESQAWVQLDTPTGFIRMSTPEQPFAEFVLDSYEYVSGEEQWQVEVENLLAHTLG